jgi:integrase/recombinase XerD
MLAYAIAHCANPSDVADLVAETFLAALTSAGRFRDVDGDAMPWLLGIARHVLSRQRRSFARQQRAQRRLGNLPMFSPDASEAITAAIDAARLSPALTRALAALPTKDRELLLLIARDGLQPASAGAWRVCRWRMWARAASAAFSSSVSTRVRPTRPLPTTWRGPLSPRRSAAPAQGIAVRSPGTRGRRPVVPVDTGSVVVPEWWQSGVPGQIPRADADRVHTRPSHVPGWCHSNNLDMLHASRAELELYVRYLVSRGYAPATVARRFGTSATFFKYAVIDELIPANPAVAVTRPKVAWEGQKRTVLHLLEFAAMLSAARTSSPVDHALVCLLGMLGLRVGEACNANITDIRYEAGYELLHVIGKGAKPADIPMPIPVLRAVKEATDGRQSGPDPADPIWTTDGPRRGQPGPDRVAHAAGVTHHISPHGLRRTFCTNRAGRRHLDPRHAVRDAPRRPSHHTQVRHGQDQPRSARGARRRLLGRNEYRLT